MAEYGDFPSSPVAKASPSNAGGLGLIPGPGGKIPQPKSQNIKQKQYYKISINTLRIVHILFFFKKRFIVCYYLCNLKI